MTLKAQMSSDVANVVLQTDEHAETATYTPRNGTPVSCAVVCERDGDLTPTTSDMERTAPVMARIFCATADVASPKLGDVFAIGDETWKVSGRPSRDGFGGQWLTCTNEKVLQVGRDRRG